MPKMSVTPAASSEGTRLCAPVICSLIPAFLFVLANKKPLGHVRATRGDASSDRSGGAPHAYEKLQAHAITLVARPSVRQFDAQPSHHTGRQSHPLAVASCGGAVGSIPSRKSAAW